MFVRITRAMFTMEDTSIELNGKILYWIWLCLVRWRDLINDEKSKQVPKNLCSPSAARKQYSDCTSKWWNRTVLPGRVASVCSTLVEGNAMKKRVA